MRWSPPTFSATSCKARKIPTPLFFRPREVFCAHNSPSMHWNRPWGFSRLPFPVVHILDVPSNTTPLNTLGIVPATARALTNMGDLSTIPQRMTIQKPNDKRGCLEIAFETAPLYTKRFLFILRPSTFEQVCRHTSF